MLLAPVVSDRKGEYQKLLQELAAQGFVPGPRRRPAGGARRGAGARAAQEAHDRGGGGPLQVRPDLQQRLAESFETALKLAGGVVRVAHMDDPAQPDLVFSANFACPVCGYSLEELEPRLFSFNNPVGACPSCDGLGVEQFFDPQKVVVHPELSLAGGAVRGWDRRNAYYFQLVRSLAKHYGFDVETPWSELPGAGPEGRAVRQRLRGHRVQLPGRARPRREADAPLRGDHPQHGPALPGDGVERRARGAGALHLVAALPRMQGTRLTEAARHVFVAEQTLPAITALPVARALAFFEALALPGKRGEIAAKIVKEIHQRLSFLVNVGLDYLTLERSAETLSGGEAQRIRLASQIGAGLVGVMYILDEPSIGLHQRDNDRLLRTLTYLRDLGNTVIVVEHDEEAIRAADHVVDIGPGAGVARRPRDRAGHGRRDRGVGGIAHRPVPLGQAPHRHPRRATAVRPQARAQAAGAKGNNLKGVKLEIPSASSPASPAYRGPASRP